MVACSIMPLIVDTKLIAIAFFRILFPSVMLLVLLYIPFYSFVLPPISPSLLYDYYCWRSFCTEVNMNVSPRAKYVVTIKILVVVSLLLFFV